MSIYAMATHDSLVGTWDGKVSVDRTQLAGHPALDGTTKTQTRGVALVFGMMAASRRMTLEFQADGTAINRLTSLGRTREKKGTWTILSQADDRVIVEMRLAGTNEKTRFAFRPVKPDQMDLIIEAPGGLAQGFQHRFTRRAER